MPNQKEITQISKFLSLVLRHKPETIGIDLDVNGWTDTDILLTKLNQNGWSIDFKTLKSVVETNAKQRFAFNSTLTKIRANQGHSIEVDLNIKSQKPPEILFHGTGSNSVLFILETGLEKKGRNHIHLSSDIETAIKVGQRHGKPFVFEILAQEMHNDNFEFYLSENGVWLTDHVPVKYLRDHAL